MKIPLYICILTILSCDTQPKQARETTDIEAEEDSQFKKIDNSRYYTKADTLDIVTEIGDTIRYERAEFNTIVDNHPEFLTNLPRDPDFEYSAMATMQNLEVKLQDTYYTLYDLYRT